MTLREEAEKAARELNDDTIGACPFDELEQTERDAIVAVIERVARAFAERTLRRVAQIGPESNYGPRPGMWSMQVGFSQFGLPDCSAAELRLAERIAATIAAAERGE